VISSASYREGAVEQQRDELAFRGRWAGIPGEAEKRRTGQPEDGEGAVVHGHDHHERVLVVSDDAVVQRALRLDVRHPVTGDPGRTVRGGNLVDDLFGHLRRVDVYRSPAEAGQIPVADMSTARYAGFHRASANPPHGRRDRRLESHTARLRW